MLVPITCAVTVPPASTSPDPVPNTNASAQIVTSANSAHNVLTHATTTSARMVQSAPLIPTIVLCTTANAQRVSPDSSVRTSMMRVARTDVKTAVSACRY